MQYVGDEIEPRELLRQWRLLQREALRAHGRRALGRGSMGTGGARVEGSVRLLAWEVVLGLGFGLGFGAVARLGDGVGNLLGGGGVGDAEAHRIADERAVGDQAWSIAGRGLGLELG